jgi:hypothetical protein
VALERQAEKEKKAEELARIKAYKHGLSNDEKAKLRERAEAEIKSSDQFKKEFITAYLIEAKENELAGKQLGMETSA